MCSPDAGSSARCPAADARAEDVGEETRLGRGEAGQQVAERASQLDQAVGVGHSRGEQPGGVGQGGDVGAGEHPLVVAGLREPHRTPQSPGMLQGNPGLFGDLQTGVAAGPGQQTPFNYLRR